MRKADNIDKMVMTSSQSTDIEEYWIRKLSPGEPVKSNFPYDRHEITSDERITNTFKFRFSDELFNLVLKLSKNSLPKLQMILIAGLVTLLSKYSGNQDILLGTLIYKQEIEADFINTILVLRNQLKDDMSFKELLLQVRETLIEADENRNYPIDLLLQKLEIPLFRNEDFPLFDVAVLLENIQDKRYLQNIKPNVIFSFLRSSEHIDGVVEYNALRYEKETIEQIVTHFMNLLERVISDVNLLPLSLDILTEQERAQLLFQVNNTRVNYPRDTTIHQLFQRQVEKTPGNTAVLCGHIHVSYRQLNTKSNQLAHRLREKGVKIGTVVAIWLERSIEMISGILGVLKAGGAYLPIEPDSRKKRISYMLDDSGAKIILTNNSFYSSLPSWFSTGSKVLLNLSEVNHPETCDLEPTAGSADLAYILYTSGTTGKPKGVMVEHRGVVNYICWAAKQYVKGEKINFPFYTSIAFDLTVTSLFTPLITGNALVVYDDKENKQILIDRIIDDNRTGVVKVTPSHLKLVRDKKIDYRSKNIKRFIVGGEELKTQLGRKIFENFGNTVEIYNEYGPTEASVGCMIHKFDHKKDTGESVPIGHPIDNTQIYILDRNFSPVPPGVIGEIYIAGDGIARGYLNQLELTRERFISFNHQDHKGRKLKELPITLYKTGDLSRWFPDGNVEFLGRIDHQVKIRGFRIELGEIESELLTHDQIKEAVIVTKEDKDGNMYLCAYIVPAKEFTVTELRNYLSQRLHDYMIPTHFIPLDKIPLTTSGKVNRKGLPDPGSQGLKGDAVYTAPRNAIEKKLVEIWQKVLGKSDVSINDNFFEVGGDSIKTIQIVSRMRDAGYKLEMRDIFQNPQISGLAHLVKKIERIADQSVITGTLLLTPIQKWFFENITIDNRYFNQAVVLYFEEGFGEEAVKIVFTKLQEHHDALRMTFSEDNGRIIQTNHGLDYPLTLELHDLRGLENTNMEIENRANRLQSSIHLAKGPLMKLGLFHLDDGDRLLVAIHHLVVDGVSWRILIEDINTLFQQYKKGEPLALPRKTDSFKLWSEKLSRYADSPSFLAEKAYWMELESRVSPPGMANVPSEKSNYMEDAVSVSFNLSEEETNLLLTKVNEAFGTEINDILLTALALAAETVYGSESLLIALEGHGREEFLNGLDISRTVGWFTSLYPVVIDIFSGDDLARQIKETKESLRTVPNKGIGYGILKYLTTAGNKKDIHFKLNPRISFNYLGQFDSDIQQMSFAIVKEKYGNDISLKGKRTFELEVSSLIASKKLMVTITYNKKQYQPESMNTFLDNYRTGLSDIVSYCLSRPGRELTPSDLTYPGLSIEKVEQLTKKYPLEDIYILSPMQEGKLFYTLYNQSSSAGSVQMKVGISGKLDLSYFERSINELFKRYDILRAAFVYEDVTAPIQIILKERRVDFSFQDLRNKINFQNKQSLIDEFAEKDRMHSFDLSRNVLMRIAILQTGDKEYELIWSFHHILMDGWCLGILFREFLDIYNSFLEKRTYKLAQVKSYKKYIQWLMERDEKEPREYWRRYLAGYDRKTSITKRKGIENRQKGYQFERVVFHLNEERMSGLHDLAAKSQVTLNTIVQTIWGIILSKYNRQEDIIFGAVVSGRPSEIPGVESMIGLFINTIPVRISCDPVKAFIKLVKQVQEQALESEPYHYYPLTLIQSESILKQELLDHILVFENYPLVEQMEGIVKSAVNRPFDIIGITEFTQPDYNLHVVIHPGNSLGIEFRFNSLVYDGNFIKKIALHIDEMVDTILYDRDIRIEDIGPADERAKAKFSDQNDYTGDFGF